MKSVLLFTAGALLVSTALANDSNFDERFKMKTGRYTFSEEQRRNTAKTSAAKDEKVDRLESCSKNGCCKRTDQALAKSPGLADPEAGARFKMKFGRNSPGEEARLAAQKHSMAAPVLLAAVRTCDRDCCKHPQ